MTQQKGETMPEVESRSNMKRKAVLRGEKMPKGENPVEHSINPESLRQPAASAEQPTFEQWWTSTEFYLGESPKSIAYRAWFAALQSVPSSLPALEKLRELEAKWRSRDWARTHINDDRPSEFICADELHAVLAPAPHPAEKD